MVVLSLPYQLTLADELELAPAATECALDHCSDICKDLKAKLELAVEERDQLISERDALQASISQAQKSGGNAVSIKFAEIAKMKKALSAMVAEENGVELKLQSRNDLVGIVDGLVTKMMDQLSFQGAF